MATKSSSKGVEKNRRRHPRIPVGLPVEVRVSGRESPFIVELVDIAKAGVRFRSLGDPVELDQTATFSFMVEGTGKCSAEGRVARVDGGTEFIVVLEKANPRFRDFVLSLSK